jgi:threonine aldolase
MRRVMAEAPVGDDVFGEDPTVNRLQEVVAELLGKEAALFVPSGVMGNQLALKVHTQPGDEVIVERQSHIPNYESGAPALLSGVQLNIIDGRQGILEPEQVSNAVRAGHYWEPRTRLFCAENTINKAGGVLYPLGKLDAVASAARTKGLATHLDGARIWNAAVASAVSERRYCEPFDTVSVCLSKGLGAPVGSVLAGPSDLIAQAHRYRKLFGGGMRQVGILAAAGLYALEHHRDRLADDHAIARRLAEGLAGIDGFTVDPAAVETNIVIFDVSLTAARILDAFRSEGVLMVAFGPHTIRATTHLDVTAADIDRVVTTAHRLFSRPTVSV